MTKEELESIELIPKLINALRETTAERDQWKVQAESAANFIEHLQSHLMVKTYDCDGWKSTAEVFKRALQSRCFACKHAKNPEIEFPLVSCPYVHKAIKLSSSGKRNCPNWQFDEVGFAGGEESK